jgi:hypothetical protein
MSSVVDKNDAGRGRKRRETRDKKKDNGKFARSYPVGQLHNNMLT